MCQYGNCHNDLKDGNAAVRVSIRHNTSGDRDGAGFCCLTHAALWLLGQARRRGLSSGEPVHADRCLRPDACESGWLLAACEICQARKETQS
jgi:hypothetical protein